MVNPNKPGTDLKLSTELALRTHKARESARQRAMEAVGKATTVMMERACAGHRTATVTAPSDPIEREEFVAMLEGQGLELTGNGNTRFLEVRWE